MDENVLELIKSGFNTIGEVVGKIAPEAWNILMRQQTLIGIQNIVGAMIGVVCIIVGIILINKSFIDKRDKDDKVTRNRWSNRYAWDDGEEVGMWILIVVLLIVGICVFIGCTMSAIGHLYNPAYYAIMDLIPQPKTCV